jgi:preprotein translocase subunit SecE
MNQLSRFKQFCIDTWAELKKTTWPGKQEVYGTTLVVIVTVLICAFFLWVVDLILNRGMEQIFKAAGQ